jgi:hypothetical protein
MLALAAKDRSADFLACAKDHPVLAGFAQKMASASAFLGGLSTIAVVPISAGAFRKPFRAEGYEPIKQSA